MSMQLISEKLLEREIKRLEDAGRPGESEILYCQCKKELAVIEKLKINKVDMRGEIEEVNQSIADNAVYFMSPQEFEAMEEKARKYDVISEIVRREENGK
ncbi:MAG: hypothetical protein K2P45_10985 [Eubacterium sp.]|nr:hypothetical protein [Eubacterium sp.]